MSVLLNRRTYLLVLPTWAAPRPPQLHFHHERSQHRSSHAYTYNDLNQRLTSELADGSTWHYKYDDMGQVIAAEKRHSSGAPYPGMGFGFAYDGIGNRTATTANSHTANYSVNEANQKHRRLVGVLDRSGATCPVGVNGRGAAIHQYTQREVPGLLAIRGSADMQAEVTLNGKPTQRLREYFYGTLEFDNSSSPQYPQIDTNAVKNDAGPNGEDLQSTTSGHLYLPKTPETFTYDAEGNLTSDGRWDYTWDGANQLVAIETPSGVPDAAKRKLEFTYDSQGRRIRKKVSEWQNNDWTLQKELLFLYDGWNLIAELELQNSTLSLRTSHTWGLDLSGTPQGAGGVGGLLAITQHASPSLSYLPTYDGNGNITALINATDGHTAATYEYGPFGESLVVKEEPGITNPFRFSSKYLDQESSLYYYGYRYLNTDTGRWLSRDPIEEGGGVNLYGFTGNRPVATIDRLGLQIAERVCKVKQLAVHSPRVTKDGKRELDPIRDGGFIHSAIQRGLGPNKDQSGSIGNFQVVAYFDDPCECCEIRQYVKTVGDARLPDHFPDIATREYVEDRGDPARDPLKKGKERRYGHRGGEYSSGLEYFDVDDHGNIVKNPDKTLRLNSRTGRGYFHMDQPKMEYTPSGGFVWFKVVVIDVCSNGDLEKPFDFR